MAAGTRVEENQLQRIIRDLHGLSALCVCVFECVCVQLHWQTSVVNWHGLTEKKRKRVSKLWFQDVCHRVKSEYSLAEGDWLTCPCQQTIWKHRHLTSCLCRKGVVAASVSMQRDRECVLRVHPSRVSFQFLRWIRGKFLCKNQLYWKSVTVEVVRVIGTRTIWVCVLPKCTLCIHSVSCLNKLAEWRHAASFCF